MPRMHKDFIESYLEYTSNHEASPKIHKWTAISILASVLERKVWIERGYYKLYPNLYIFIIGPSGLIKKSTSTSIGVDLLRDIEGFNIMTERATDASLCQQIERAGKKKSFLYNGAPVRQSPVYAYASELAVFLQEINKSIIELLTTFFDCQPNDSSKPWRYGTRHTGDIVVYGPCLNLLGCSTPSWLLRCVPKSEMEGGFASRILFVVENEPPVNPVAWPKVDESKKHDYFKLGQTLKHIHNLKGKMVPTDAAFELYEKWYRIHCQKVIPKNSDTRFSGYYGRKGDQMLKLAMVRSISQRDDLILTEQDILWASDQLHEMEKTMFDIFKDPKHMGGKSLVKQMHEYISDAGRVSATALRQKFWINTSPENYIEAIETLKAGSYIVETKSGPNDIAYTLPTSDSEE